MNGSGDAVQGSRGAPGLYKPGFWAGSEAGKPASGCSNCVCRQRTIALGHLSMRKPVRTLAQLVPEVCRDSVMQVSHRRGSCLFL